MQAEYKRDMSHNYLVLHAEKEIDTASYQVRMLVGNTIPSLLKCRFQGMDGSFMIYYEITSKQSMASLFEEKKLNYQDLQMVFGGFMQTLEEMSEYLLNPGRLVIRPEYMFVDVERREVYFCYLPDYEKDVRQQFQELTEYILPRLDHEDQKAVMLGYGVYRRAMDDSFHLEYIKEELYRDSEEKPRKELAFRETSECGEDFGKEPPEDGAETERRRSLKETESRPNWSENEDAFVLHRDMPEETQKRANRGETFLWKRLAGCTVGAVLLLGVFAAELLGYLPWIEMEDLLAGVLVLAGVGALIFAVFRFRKKKKRPEIRRQPGVCEKRGPVSAEEMDPDWFGEETDQKEENRVQENKIQKSRDKREEPSYNYGRRLGRDEKGEKDCPGKDSFGETVVLSAGVTEGPATLVSREPGELATIYLQDELTVIGKLENAADAVISLPTVSRVHAKIRCRDGEYYLSDLNSRNGTSVNGQMLLPDQEHCLQDQDQVDFAQARYVFVR